MAEDNDTTTLIAEIKESFRGRSRGLIIVVWAEALCFSALAVWSAFQFFRADTTRDLILFATLFLAAFIATVAVKLWYYNWLNRAAVLRAVARLEQKLARPE